MNRRIAVRAVIVQDGKLLCVQNKPYNTYVNVREWSTPGGGIDEMESIVPALQREIFEELGVHALIGKLLYVQQFYFGDKEHMQFFFHVTNPQDFAAIDLSITSHGENEIARVTFIDPATEGLRPRFLALEPLSEDIAGNGPVKFFSTLENISS
jgi:ADP-ribose pyrophosphatase YjhB (NUDIX family)